jgi:Ran GTPase-activating protein (RanGAP) involved in mRNA processing and transport
LDDNVDLSGGYFRMDMFMAALYAPTASRLRKLILRHGRESDVAMRAVVVRMADMTCLTHLGLQHVGVEIAVELAAALRLTRNLTTLDLSHNLLSPMGVAADVPRLESLATSIGRLPSLRVLDLSCSDLDPMFVRHLYGDGSLTDLQDLCLCGNPEIGSELSGLLSALPPTMRKFGLTNTGVGCSGAMALFGRFPALEELDLSYNSMGMDQATALCRALPRMSKLRTLRLTGNTKLTENALRMIDAIMNPRMVMTDTLVWSLARVGGR